jgi:hypothetical protein
MGSRTSDGKELVGIAFRSGITIGGRFSQGFSHEPVQESLD